MRDGALLIADGGRCWYEEGMYCDWGCAWGKLSSYDVSGGDGSLSSMWCGSLVEKVP
jgi:hypothetical protein